MMINNNINNLYINIPAYGKKNEVSDEIINNNNNFNNNFNNPINKYRSMIMPKDENLDDLIIDYDNFINNQTDDFLSSITK